MTQKMETLVALTNSEIEELKLNLESNDFCGAKSKLNALIERPVTRSDAYIQQEEAGCPKCRQSDIEAGSENFEADGIYRNYRCNTCEASWSEKYQLTAITDAVGFDPDEPVEQRRYFMIKGRAFDIQWDIDDENELADLPSTMDFEIRLETDENQLIPDEVEDTISDELTSRTGFCHNGFGVSYSVVRSQQSE